MRISFQQLSKRFVRPDTVWLEKPNSANPAISSEKDPNTANRTLKPKVPNTLSPERAPEIKKHDACNCSFSSYNNNTGTASGFWVEISSRKFCFQRHHVEQIISVFGENPSNIICSREVLIRDSYAALVLFPSPFDLWKWIHIQHWNRDHTPKLLCSDSFSQCFNSDSCECWPECWVFRFQSGLSQKGSLLACSVDMFRRVSVWACVNPRSLWSHGPLQPIQHPLNEFALTFSLAESWDFFICPQNGTKIFRLRLENVAETQDGTSFASWGNEQEYARSLQKNPGFYFVLSSESCSKRDQRTRARTTVCCRPVPGNPVALYHGTCKFQKSPKQKGWEQNKILVVIFCGRFESHQKVSLSQEGISSAASVLSSLVAAMNRRCSWKFLFWGTPPTQQPCSFHWRTTTKMCAVRFTHREWDKNVSFFHEIKWEKTKCLGLFNDGSDITWSPQTPVWSAQNTEVDAKTSGVSFQCSAAIFTDIWTFLLSCSLFVLKLFWDKLVT